MTEERVVRHGRIVAGSRGVEHWDAAHHRATTSLLELAHVLRGDHRLKNPELAECLVAFLSRSNVELVDADQAAAIAGIRWTLRASARRIPDALIAAAAEHAGCDWIATFDERMASPTVPVRTI